MSSSRLSNIPAPFISQAHEPLPQYSRRDPEAISIHSSAPSYVSEAPTYKSCPSHDHHQTTLPSQGLQPPTYAPGFHHPHSTSTGDITNHCFNINEWSSAKNGHQARHYQNVVNRRATLSSVSSDAKLNTIAQKFASPSSPSTPYDTNPSAEYFPHSCTNTGATAAEEDADSLSPISPLEDPDLVGLEAATLARERRLYMQRRVEETEALNQEGKSWDFMLSQMADWKERERSWEMFRQRKGIGKLRAGRFGMW